MTYQIWQMKSTKENVYRIFQSLDMLSTMGEKPAIKNYKMVYEGDVDDGKPVHQVLEELYEIFNLRHPIDFCGHSLSVSDVVLLDDIAWYCDRFGWKQIDNFL